MITSITIQNWKSFREARLSVAPLTLMLGANASGKSNAIEAIRCLSWLAEGRRLSEIVSSVQGDDQLIRGTIENLTRHGEGSFALGCETGEPDWDRYCIAIQVSPEGLRVVGEEVTAPSGGTPLFSVCEPAAPFSHAVEVQYNNFSRGGKKPRLPATDEQSVLSQLTTPARFGAQGKAQEIIPVVVERFRTALTATLFLDPSPRAMRQYSFIVDNVLKGDGANLSSVLFELCERRQRKADVLRFIRELPEQNFRDITFLRTPRNEVMLQLTETFGRRKRQTWDAPVLSDGTLRVLAVAAALLSAPEGSLVVIEEIDNGVHPSRAGMLLANIERIATERGLRVLLTSHNPALVDTLPADATPDIVYCYRDPVEGDSRLVRLEDLPNYPELVARGPLGQLMTRGILERMVKNPPDPEARREAGEAWLDTLLARVG